MAMFMVKYFQINGQLLDLLIALILYSYVYKVEFANTIVIAMNFFREI